MAYFAHTAENGRVQTVEDHLTAVSALSSAFTAAFCAGEQGKLIGLAACSADCPEMWQIGIDVLPEYRRKGIAAALTSRLAVEILNRDKVPFYCCAWCNLPSARNAVKSGFRPAWTEMQADALEHIAEMN